MGEVTITTEEYKALVEASVLLHNAERYIERKSAKGGNYIDLADLAAVMGLELKEEVRA